MGLLDFIRNRKSAPENADPDPRAHGHATWKGVFDEIRGDEALAKLRNETGQEPESPGKQVNEDHAKVSRRKGGRSWER